MAKERTIHDKWYTTYFFRNKTFLFVKIESWNFQHIFDLEVRETLQNFSSFRWLFLWGVKVVWMNWNFVIFHGIKNQRDAINFRLLYWQKKSCYSKKNWVYHAPWIALFSANRWRLDVLTFLLKGFGVSLQL